MIRWSYAERALDASFSARAVTGSIVICLGGVGVADAAREAEGLAFVGFLALMVLAALGVTFGPRIRDAVLPFTEALAAAGGALLAIAFGLGVTDVQYMKAPSTGQLLMVVGSVTLALVSARLQIAREDRHREHVQSSRLEKIELTQEAILSRVSATRRKSLPSSRHVAPGRVRRHGWRR